MRAARGFGLLEPVTNIPTPLYTTPYVANTLPPLTAATIPRITYAPTTRPDGLDTLASAFTKSAQAMTSGLTNYFDTMTAVQQMQAANRAGVPVAAYSALNTPANAAASVLGNQIGTAKIAGIPLWVILVGAGLVLVTKK